MSVTVKDVAKKAGVATSTVSRVVNDHPSISEDTKKKVRKIMAEMGYVPNLAARNLGKQISSAIGVILPPLDSKERLGNPARDFDTLLKNVERMHLQKQVDGFILVYSDEKDPIIDYLVRKKVPFTLIGHPYSNEQNIVFVDNDNQMLGKQATEYLISQGHSKILFATNTTHENLYFERFFGYQKAMMLANLPFYPALTFEQAEDYVNFETTIKETEATAIVVIDDLFAVRIIQLATMFGYKVPDDLSVISFNNSIFATLTHPYLTSIDINVLSLGKIATESLMAQLNHEGSNAVQLVVPHKLIKRETVLNLNNLA